MSRTWKRFLLALVGGGLAVRWATHPMGLKLALWQRAWGQRYGPVEGRKLAARVRRRYDLLRADCPYQPDRALRYILDDNILPGLALYRAISDDVAAGRAGGEPAAGLSEPEADQNPATGGQKAAESQTPCGVQTPFGRQTPFGHHTSALQETERLFKAASGPYLLPVRLLGVLPNPFPFFRWAVKKLIALGSPTPGWEFRVVEDSPQRLAIDAQRCFYLDTLRRYGAAEMTPLFCVLDDWMMAEMPASIGWRRTGTLGRGDAVCNFDWCHQS